MPLLYDWNNDPKNLKINFKFGQYGTNAIKNAEKAAQKEEKELKDLIDKGKVAAETISSYSGIYLSPKVVLHIRSLDEYLSNKNSKYKTAIEVEKAVQKALTAKGWYNATQLKSTEVFAGGTLQELMNIIEEVISGTGKINLRPKEEQKEGIGKIAQYFSASPQNKEFLLAAKMRYGKNITILSAIKQLNELFPNKEYKNILVMTYKPGVFPSLKDDIEKFSQFDNFEVVEINKQKNIPIESDKIRIFISSAQYALYGANLDKNINENLFEAKGDHYEKQKMHTLAPEEEVEKMQQTAYEDYDKNLDKLKQIPFGIIVADEYHYGTRSANFKKLLEELNYNKIIYVSGTAMKDMATGRFDDSQVYNWTYIDEQKKKRQELAQYKKDPDGYYPNIDMPTMHFYKMQLCPEALQMARNENLYSEDEGFSFAKCFGVNKTGKLINEQLVKVLLEQIITPKHGQVYSILNDNVTDTNLDHTFWVFPKSVKSIKAVANLMRTMSIFKNYEIIEATGELNNNIEKVKNKIREANNNGRKSITMSCYRFKEGTTVPEWGAVIMLDQGTSPEEYLQAIFRCQSPGPKDQKGNPIKKNCYVFDYNPQRFTVLYHDIAQWSSKTGKGGEFEITKEFIKYAPILQVGENTMVPMSAEDLIRNFHQHASFREQMAAENVFNFSNIKRTLDDDLVEAFKNISSKKNATTITVSDHGLKKAKDAKLIREPKDGGVEDWDDEEEAPLTNLDIQKEKIRNFLRTLPTFMMASEDAEESIDNIINTKQPQLFEEITGITPDILKKLVDRGVLLRRTLNEKIAYFKLLIDEFENNPTAEAAESFINRHMIIRAEEGSTPLALVNEMLDKLPENVWKDKNKRFLDPCCGMGKFLVGIKQRLMEGLKESIPNEQEREKHIIENMIYGNDIQQYKTIMSRKLLGNKSYKYNITNEDSLTKQWNMKFDVIVGNPPYKRDLHLKFLQLAVNYLSKLGNIIWIHPARWLQDPTAVLKENSDYIKYKNLPFTDFKIIYNADAQKIFNISITSDLCISTLKNGKESILNEDKIYELRDIPISFKRFLHMKYTSINDVTETNKYEGIRVKIINIQIFATKDGRDYIKNRYMIFHPNHAVPFIDGKYNNKDWTQLVAKNQFSKSEGSAFPISIKFNTINEAKNFINSTNTEVFQFFNYLTKLDVHIQLQYLPFMNDYTNPWTNERFKEYFNITDDEMLYILETMKKYK